MVLVGKELPVEEKRLLSMSGLVLVGEEVLAVEEPQERLGLALGGWEVGQTIAPNALDLLAHPVKSSMPRFPCSTLHRLTLTGRKN